MILRCTKANLKDMGARFRVSRLLEYQISNAYVTVFLKLLLLFRIQLQYESGRGAGPTVLHSIASSQQAVQFPTLVNI